MGANLFPGRRNGWLITIGYVALIYLSLEPVGTFQLYLKRNGWQTPVAEAILVLSAAAALYLVFVRLDRRSPGHVVAVIAVGVAYAAMMIWFAPRPSDRIHLIEYSMLAIFLFYALKFDVAPWGRYPLAWGGAFSVGFVDELIQDRIPTRAYDLHDAALNGGAALVALMFVGLAIERENR
jgi:hypothetical protein